MARFAGTVGRAEAEHDEFQGAAAGEVRQEDFRRQFADHVVAGAVGRENAVGFHAHAGAGSVHVAGREMQEAADAQVRRAGRQFDGGAGVDGETPLDFVEPVVARRDMGGQMADGLDVPEGVPLDGGVADVSVQDGVAPAGERRRQGAAATQGHDPVAGVQQGGDDVLPDESGCAGDEHALPRTGCGRRHRRVPSPARTPWSRSSAIRPLGTTNSCQ